MIKDTQLLGGAQRELFFVKKSETLWKCRETKIGRLYNVGKCDTLAMDSFFARGPVRRAAERNLQVRPRREPEGYRRRQQA